jgi:hypothetical protein
MWFINRPTIVIFLIQREFITYFILFKATFFVCMISYFQATLSLVLKSLLPLDLTSNSNEHQLSIFIEYFCEFLYLFAKRYLYSTGCAPFVLNFQLIFLPITTSDYTYLSLSYASMTLIADGDYHYILLRIHLYNLKDHVLKCL